MSAVRGALKAAGKGTSREFQRGLVLALSLVTGALGASLGNAGCVDLFHSTDFGGGCSDDAGCGDGSTAVDAHRHHDASTDAPRDAGDATTHDARPDHEAEPDAPSDALDATSPDAKPDVHQDGAADAVSEAAPEAGPDVVLDAGAPPGTDFCQWSAQTAAANAEKACVFLGSCAGSIGLNDFGVCYPNALLAYDCTLNPNQQVHGALHAFWDALWQVTDCGDVMKALFPTTSGTPDCSNLDEGCSRAEPNVAVNCSDPTFGKTAINCDMVGYTCMAGKCTVPNGAMPCADSVDASTAPFCADGGVLHSCQRIEQGGEAVVVDVGKACKHFGSGECIVDGGAVGCAPNGASTACTPSSAVTCLGGDAGVTGCATGHLEKVLCPRFGPLATCNPDGGYPASAEALAGGCFNGVSPTPSQCVSATFGETSGPSGLVDVNCSAYGNFSVCDPAVGDAGAYCAQ